MRRSNWLLLITVFAVLTLVYTFPLWTAPDSLLTGPGDPRLNAWILAWGVHGLATSAGDVFDANIFHPRSNALAMSENLLGSTPLAAPFVALGKPVLAYNVLLLSSFFLFGIGVALWIRALTKSTSAGIVAGVAATFAPSRLDHLHHIQLLSAYWVPLVLLFTTRYAQTRRPRYLLFATLSLAWQYWTGIQLTLLMLPALLMYGLVLLAWQERPQVRLTIVHLALASGLFLALTLPVSLPYLSAADEGMTRTLTSTAGFAASPLSFLSPSGINRAPHLELMRRFQHTEANHFSGFVIWCLLGAVAFHIVRRGRQTGGRPHRPIDLYARRGVLVAGSLYAGVVLTSIAGWSAATATLSFFAPAVVFCIALTVAPLCARPQAATDRLIPLFGLCLAIAGIGHLLALGPAPSLAGVPIGPGPFRALFAFIPYQSIRAVGRFGLISSLFLSAAAGIGTAYWMKRCRLSRLAVAGMIALIFLEYWPVPLPAVAAWPPDEQVYEDLATLPGDGAVIHIPLFPPPRPSEASQFLLGSTRHWRPLVNGYSGFSTEDLRQLAEMEPMTEEFFERLARTSPVQYLVLHGALMDSEDRDAYLLAAARSDQIRHVSSAGNTHVYEWRQLPRIGSSVALRVASSEDLFERPLNMDVRSSRRRPMEVEFVWGDRVVGRHSLTRNWDRVAVPVPRTTDARVDGAFDLHFDFVATPRWDRSLGSTAATLRANVVVNVRAHQLRVVLNEGWRVIHSPRSSVLCVELDADGARIAAYRRFNTDEAGLLDATEYLLSVPDGTVVAVASGNLEAGHGARALERFVSSLKGLGAGEQISAADLRRYALVGVRGAAAGSVPEHESSSSARVRAGPPANRFPQLEVRAVPTNAPGS